MWNEKLVTRALFFATEKHKNQIMKHPANMPYTAHVTGVMLNAIKLASEVENINYDLLVCSALLHDTLEDTDTLYEELEAEFGTHVADAVLALSKNPNLSKKDRMKDSIERIKKQPKEVAIVKLADRLFNVRDRVPTWSEEKIEEYKKETKLIFEELGYVVPSLKTDLEQRYQMY